MKDKIRRVIGKISTERHLLAIRDSMAVSMVLILIGSIFLMIANLPIEAFTTWLSDNGILEYLNKAADSTFGLLGLSVTFCSAYFLAKYYKKDSLSMGLLAIACYVLVTPLVSAEEGQAFLFMYFGSKGMFVGIVVGLLTTEICRFFINKEWKIKMPKSVPVNVSRSFEVFVPGLLTVFVWLLVVVALRLIGIDNMHQIISGLMEKPMSYIGNNLLGVIMIILIQCFFWSFGIHGAQITSPILEPILFQNTDANRIAFQMGAEVPNIVTYEFMNSFVFIGGAGAVLGLAFVVFLFARSNKNKTLGKLCVAPVSFQVAEPLLFGLPTILNPIMLIPFVLAPILCATISFSAMSLGIIPKLVGIAVPWTTPIIISGYIATGGHISGAILQIVLLLVSMAVYYPFFKYLDNRQMKEENELKDIEVVQDEQAFIES